MRTLNRDCNPTLFRAVQRLNWLYGKGELTTIVHVTGDDYKAVTQKQYGTFEFSVRFDGVTVRALRHQARLR